MATHEEQRTARHARRIIRVLRRATCALRKRHTTASYQCVWPRTTRKAYYETLLVLRNTELRVLTRDADVV